MRPFISYSLSTRAAVRFASTRLFGALLSHAAANRSKLSLFPAAACLNIVAKCFASDLDNIFFPSV